VIWKNALLLLLIASSAPACYLGHVARGQLRLLRASQPIETVLDDPATPAAVRLRLTLVLEVREFARALGLSVEDQYTRYAPWPGDHVVTTVVTTRPGEVHPAGFWFPIVGRVPYKGYFEAARAASEAERLRGRGFDVCLVKVPAYSTLGWFDDPVTDPMLRLSEGSLVETLLHELTHATIFVRDHAAFNEGIASFVGEEARVRFYAAARGTQAADAERRQVTENRRVQAELLRVRDEIESLYASRQPDAARDAQRADIETRGRAHIARLELASRDASELASGIRLNDACLALVGTYASEIDRFAAALASLGGDLQAFLKRARQAAGASDPERALLDVE
jgi:predicted aminopeptidase